MKAYLCSTCGDKILGNIPFVLEIIDMLGYHKYEFCKLVCLLTFVVDNYKKQLKKMLK